ncbi:nonribosomal peptide synthase -like [Pyrenophora seminiperda CCB06]|uniref:Nonribosomal peptide synthase-like n=1 Tax=Pyrenophora seminiperda CCB06 TaxID=1302712 RepID=A0A3M7LVN9_9PLEO|nr:nonribosomal peptide synthase -like [Pyrenophora seminiperda CCB06]
MHPNAVTRPTFGAPPRNSIRSKSAIIELPFDTDVTTLRNHCRRSGITLASLYYAAWALALARYTDTSQVCFGVVLSGRSLPVYEVESVIGPTINTLPFYVSINNDSAPLLFLNEVFRSLLDLISFQWSAPSQGYTRNFASAVNISPLRETSRETSENSYFEVQSDIPIQVEIGEGSRVRIHYDSSAFEEAHVYRLGTAFVKALGVVQDTAATVGSQISSLGGEEEKRILAKMGNWSSKRTRINSVSDDLVSLFMRTAKTYPTAIAIESPSTSLTYAELDERSSHVAKHLAQYVSPGNVVGASADKTANWIVAIYAILKAGAIYCPFDNDLPEAICATNFTTTGAKLFLTSSTKTKSLKPTTCNFCLSIEELLESDPIPSTSLAGLTNPSMGAYLCFTSGSTGRPKGVMCRHRGLVAFQQDLKVRLGARPGWKIAQFMSPAFDGSIHEIFSSLSYGATLVLKDATRPFDHLKKADAAILTPSVAHSLEVSDFPNLKSVYLVGEAVPQSVSNKWAVKNLFNMYGPTEATCGATIKRLTINEPVTLGHPNPSTRIYLLDSQRRLVPWGAIGEIYLAGVQVANGYIGLPDVTSSRFLPDTINPDCEGEYMYRTGDRAYWTEAGELSLLGRSDREVKLRGFRIDLDDIEVRMVRAHTACTAAAVTIQDGELTALVQPADLDLAALKRDIGKHIPTYALPRRIQAFDTFPTTPIGKLDYRAITDMPSAETPPGKQEGPMSDSEKLVVAALRDVLDIPIEVGMNLDVNIADFGADSMTHLALSHRLSHHFSQPVPLRVVLGSSTVRKLAQTMEMIKTTESSRAFEALGDQRVSPIERDWWEKYQLSDETSAFNVSYAFVISHIICDYTTLKTLLHEVADTYKGKKLPSVAKSYADTIWSTPAAHCHLSFWTEWLTGASLSRFPVGLQTTRQRWTGSSCLFTVSKILHSRLLKFGTENKFSMHQLALAAVALALQSDQDKCDMTLGAPYMNRNSEADTGVVGLFLEPLPIRVQFPCPQPSQIASTPHDETFLAAVKRCSRQALSHAIPWDQLLSHLGLESNFPNHPLFDVMVSFHEADHETQFPIEGVEFVPTWTEGAKFKLMVEFTARSDGSLSLRLEYSDECFTKKDVELMALLVTEALEGLISGGNYWEIISKLSTLRST